MVKVIPAIKIGLLLLFCFPSISQADFKPKVPLQPKHTWNFEGAGVSFSNEFSGARLNDVVQLGKNLFSVTIVPENSPINRSPWYAFKILSREKETLTVQFRLSYPGIVARPKLSLDGKSWFVLEKEKWKPANAEKNTIAEATLDIGPGPLWIFAHQPVGLKELNEWMDSKAKKPFVKESVIGKSQESRPVRQLQIGSGNSPNYVFVIGRQHPPEVTGSIGLMAFVNAISSDSVIARQFRTDFKTVVIPVVNPDGVEHGHWRSTLGGVDANRDYGPFTQLETRNVRDSLGNIARQPNARVWLFLDFHSTNEDVFYTQPDSERTFPLGFTSQWLKGIHDRFPNYSFKRESNHNENLPTSKAWAFKSFGCAGITYEFGYSTPFEKVEEIASGAAEEMMKILINHLKSN